MDDRGFVFSWLVGSELSRGAVFVITVAAVPYAHAHCLPVLGHPLQGDAGQEQHDTRSQSPFVIGGLGATGTTVSNWLPENSSSPRPAPQPWRPLQSSEPVGELLATGARGSSHTTNVPGASVAAGPQRAVGAPGAVGPQSTDPTPWAGTVPPTGYIKT